jgi:hypothetical protein
LKSRKEPKAVTPDSHETSKLTPEEKKSAVESMLNNLLADKFKSIDDVKSIITTIAFEGGYDDIAAILNEVADSSTIEIGMIQKALGIVSPSTDDSIKTGADKAEKIAEPDNTQKAEAESPKDESLTPVKHE